MFLFYLRCISRIAIIGLVLSGLIQAAPETAQSPPSESGPAQLQRLMSERKWVAAADCGIKLLESETDPAELRRMQVRTAQALLRRSPSGTPDPESLQQIIRLAEAVMLGGPDLWFCEAVTVWAAAQGLAGDYDEAREALIEQIPLYEAVEKSLQEQQLSVEAFSPVANARFVLGACHEHDAAATKDREWTVRNLRHALNEYLHVAAVYPDSDFAPEAGFRAERLTRELEAMNQRVLVDFGAYAGNMARLRFRAAAELLESGRFAEAAAHYLTLLNAFPDTTESPRALRNLALARLALGDDSGAATAVRYLAERYGRSGAAPDELLRLARNRLDAAHANQALAWYALYLEHCGTHHRVPSVLLALSQQHRQAGDAEEADRLLDRLIAQYQQSPEYGPALRVRSWTLFRQKQYDVAIPYFEKLAIVETEPVRQIRTRFAQGACLYRTGRYQTAFNLFRELEKDAVQQEVHEDEVQAKCAFLQGRCRENNGTESGIAEALPLYDRTATAYPLSAVAPQALLRRMRIFANRADLDAAAAAAERLSHEFPATPEAARAWYHLLKFALETEAPATVQAAAHQLLDRAEACGPEALYLAAKQLAKAEHFAEAAPLYAAAGALHPPFRDQALFGAAECLHASGKTEETLAALESLLTEFPAFSNYYQAKFLFAETAWKLDRRTEAEAALGDVLSHATDPLLIHRANYELGRIAKTPGEQLAAFQRVALLADPACAELRPLIESALRESIRLAQELNRPQILQAGAADYLRIFPDGPFKSTAETLLKNMENENLHTI